MKNVLVTTGKRKNAVCSIRMTPNGSGEITINNMPIKNYFRYDLYVDNSIKPFDIVQTSEKFDVQAKIVGGGLSAQSDALRHAIAQGLAKFNEEWRASLKAAKFLTRDSRVKERKKYGLKSARKAPQYSKR